jgi:predicted permease
MQDEMRMHLEKRVEVLIGSGMSPADARLAAGKEFGNVGVLQEEGRDARGTRWLDSFAGDVRFALRHFARHKWTTATIVVVLSVGIAVHAFEWTLLRLWTVKPPPGIPASVPLVRVRGMYRVAADPKWRDRWLPYPEVQQIANLRDVFSSVAVSAATRVIVTTHLAADDVDEKVVRVFFVNDDYFRTLGVPVLRGPGLPRPTSSGELDLAAVVSDAAWNHILGKPDSAGGTIYVNNRPVRIVGVAPPRFASAVGSDNPGPVIWMPLAARPLILAGSGVVSAAPASPDSALFEVVGRLREGMTADSAAQRIRVVSARVTAAIAQPGGPNAPRALGPNTWRILYDADAVDLRGDTGVDSDLRTLAVAWGAFSTLVLLIVCTNVSGLVASSAATRGHEIAVRLSLGASRGRLVRQLLTESCLLSFGAGLVGAFIYWSAFRVAGNVEKLDYYSMDGGTLLLTLMSAAGVGILFGLAPALHASRGDVRGALVATGRTATGPSRLQRFFVSAQITLTQPLLVVIASLAGMLLMNTEKKLNEGVVDQVIQFSIGTSSLAGSPEERVASLQRMFAHIQRTPGVVSVLPQAEHRAPMKFSVAERDSVGGTTNSAEVNAGYQVIRPGFFKLLDVPLLRGNDAVVADSTRSVVIGADLARMLWGEADPVGRRIEAAFPNSNEHPRYLVTGVYDSRFIGEADKPVVYRVARNWWPSTYLVRTSRPAADLMIPIRRAIRAELPSTPIESWTTLAAEQAERDAGAKDAVLVISGSVIAVLLISCIGLYGVVSLAVVQRQREIGIRMALGAQAREVVALFYRSGMKLTVAGLVFGLPISLIGAQLVETYKPGDVQRSPNLLLVGGAVAGVMVIVATLATLFPATRAATVDPVTALRSE